METTLKTQKLTEKELKSALNKLSRIKLSVENMAKIYMHGHYTDMMKRLLKHPDTETLREIFEFMDADDDLHDLYYFMKDQHIKLGGYANAQ